MAQECRFKPRFGYCLSLKLLIGIALISGFVLSGRNAFGGAILSSTAVQSGVSADSPGVRVVKIGTFTFDQGFSSFTQVQLRAWINLAGRTLIANTPGEFNSPTLVFAQHSVDNDWNLGRVDTDLQITNFVNPSSGIDQQTSDWISLTHSQGTGIANLVNSDPLGRIDAYLVSTLAIDFHLPSSSTFARFTGPGQFTLETLHYTSTIRLLAVPEPSSLIVLGVGTMLSGLSVWRRRRGC